MGNVGLGAIECQMFAALTEDYSSFGADYNLGNSLRSSGVLAGLDARRRCFRLRVTPGLL